MILKNEILNVYETRAQKPILINNLEQLRYLSNNYDNYNSSLSNYKDINDQKKIIKDENNENETRKKSAPKRIVSNIIYNKKQLNIKKLKKQRKINYYLQM